MFSHKDVWEAIDRLAANHDLSASGLARRAGLDSTTFNKSKRFAADGRARWPSTESLAKVMEATGSTLDEFMGLISQGQVPAALASRAFTIPVVGLAQAGAGGFFDDAGFPAGEGWDRIPFPAQDSDEAVYALEITGDSMQPLYRDGDRIIVAPGAAVRRGDRVVVRTRGGEVTAKILKRQTASHVELQSANPAHEDRIVPLDEIEWIARILWASQ